MATSLALPEYKTPPLVEVACGVQFAPIKELLVPHFGLLWELYRAEYPKCMQAPPLARVVERFTDNEGGAVQNVGVLAFDPIPPLPRIWFIHDTDTAVIQVQTDRFLYNWRRVPDADYPRYGQVVQAFDKHFSTFTRFLHEYEFGPPIPSQFELTYVNHIPQGMGWKVLGDIGNVFPDLGWRPSRGRYLPDPDEISWKLSSLLPSGDTRLHATVGRMMLDQTKPPLLTFELTARGFGGDSSDMAREAWFNRAHEAIVHAFADLTSDVVQEQVWGRLR